ncbi:phosphoethanolamine--lipid A transferase [Pseudomonas sp. sp1636]|uniref:phosphoethanolamine transferase n=1 Tax=Pseudomonas sp. sp1636 TaxID=3036707 RepID=UPI0025A5FFE9|nr:phosphoethanolamine--lipid A transferase [Pseudomonas sp. sp1636]MDM8347790.1 phosphoethanolamine--lipid A transferase [Pseudomonas sp. sp1636]
MRKQAQATEHPQGSAKRTFAISRNVLIMAVALWLLLTMNIPFWRDVWQGVGGWSNDNRLFLISLPLLVWLWLYLLLSLLAWGRLTKASLGVLLLVSAAASFFMSSYGIVIDYNMLANVLQTDSAEALDLFSWGMLGWLFALGVVPALVVSRVCLITRPWTRELGFKLASMALALACLGGIAMSNYQSYASLLRNHHELRLLLTPSNVAAAVHGYSKRQFATPAKLQVVGADAHQVKPVGGIAKPKLTILVVGETARAANFSLNGYPRPTNPELAKQAVISFSNARSCGTATAVSVPCMFLDVGHANYKDSMSKNREGLLDVLQRAGVAVLWRDNNSGCKGACDRVPTDDVSHLQIPGLCQGHECHDQVLLSGLQSYLDKLDHDAVVVLHMKGSHGPAYFKRYPAAFEKFTPVCRDNQLDRCSADSIVNAYDNSLTYTDHVLAQTIELLKGNAGRFDTAMLYMSDHGESLGENGLYLHGLPYAMAPSEQTHVPMIVWLSAGLEQRSGIQASCLAKQQGVAYSHDNLFHSILGLMDVRTSAYQPERDLFRQCLPQNTVSVGSGVLANGLN